MNTLIKIICILIINITGIHAQDIVKQDIVVNVTNLSSNDGKVIVAVFDSESNFLKKGMLSKSATIEKHSSAVVFKNIPQGIYAISIYHDENNNGFMDKNFMGIPKEDYGCSNNTKGFMGPPKWEDAKFELNNKTSNHNIKL